MEEKYKALLLDHQLCFPLYACARETIKLYKPYLDELDLTYTQYITMMVLWEHRQVTSKVLGDRLYLDSGTLTPVLKKLEEKGFVARQRFAGDERSLLVTLTPAGEALRERALDVPRQMGACVKMEPGDAAALYGLLHKLLAGFSEE